MNRTPLSRRSYAFTPQDLNNLNGIREKCREVDITDSHIIRVALYLAARLSEKEWAIASQQVPKMIQGKQPKSK